MVLDTLNKNHKNCDVARCKEAADYALYPDARKSEQLAVFLCSEHRNIVLEHKNKKEHMYRVASSFITQSLV